MAPAAKCEDDFGCVSSANASQLFFGGFAARRRSASWTFLSFARCKMQEASSEYSVHARSQAFLSLPSLVFSSFYGSNHHEEQRVHLGSLPRPGAPRAPFPRVRHPKVIVQPEAKGQFKFRRHKPLASPPLSPRASLASPPRHAAVARDGHAAAAAARSRAPLAPPPPFLAALLGPRGLGGSRESGGRPWQPALATQCRRRAAGAFAASARRLGRHLGRPKSLRVPAGPRARRPQHAGVGRRRARAGRHAVPGRQLRGQAPGGRLGGSEHRRAVREGLRPPAVAAGFRAGVLLPWRGAIQQLGAHAQPRGVEGVRAARGLQGVPRRREETAPRRLGPAAVRGHRGQDGQRQRPAAAGAGAAGRAGGGPGGAGEASGQYARGAAWGGPAESEALRDAAVARAAAQGPLAAGVLGSRVCASRAGHAAARDVSEDERGARGRSAPPSR
eukprot:scaffold91_cov254-Pinguiococcus_pyrenoidosus.AAC.33